MNIRRFRREDARKTSSLIKKTLRETNATVRSPQEVEALASRQNPSDIIQRSREGSVYVALEGDKLVGTVSLVSNEIQALYVHPAYHHHRIGELLLRHIEQVAKQQGFKHVRVHSGIFARRFYKKHGFKEGKKRMHEIDGCRYVVFEMNKRI